MGFPFWRKLMQSRSGHPQNFKLTLKFSLIRPVFPDYLSVSYDYAIAWAYAKNAISKYVDFTKLISL